MSKQVQRFILKAIPKESHKIYFPWQTATLCILIGDDNKISAFTKAVNLIETRNWTPISTIHKSTLVEELIYHQEQYVIDEYENVKAGIDSFIELPDNWCGFKDSPPLLFPKITEDLINKVFKEAGGERFGYNEKIEAKNADYLIDDYIFELKIIEEERLLKKSVQEKIWDYYCQNLNGITPENFDDIRHSIFVNIFKSPIENAIKSASKQIKSTRGILNDSKYKGGLLIINNGTSSFTPNIFNECVHKSLKNNTNNIESAVIINIWSETDGFNSNSRFSFEPKTPNEIEKRIIESFKIVINKHFTDWGHDLFSQCIGILSPLKTISFQKDDTIFVKESEDHLK